MKFLQVQPRRGADHQRGVIAQDHGRGGVGARHDAIDRGEGIARAGRAAGSGGAEQLNVAAHRFDEARLGLGGRHADRPGTVREHAASDAQADILQALVALGYSDKEAALALKALPKEATVSEGIKLALKALAK